MVAKRIRHLHAFLAFLVFLTMVFAGSANCQSKDQVTLTVEGRGSSVEEAHADAVRAALRGTMKSFVLVERMVVADELLKNNVAILTEGFVRSVNIQKLTRSGQTPEVVRLEAEVVVSRNELRSYLNLQGILNGSSLKANRNKQQEDSINRSSVIYSLVSTAWSGIPYIATAKAIALDQDSLDKVNVDVGIEPDSRFMKTLKATLAQLKTLPEINLVDRYGNTDDCSSCTKICLSSDARASFLERTPSDVVVDNSPDNHIESFQMEPNSEFAGLSREKPPFLTSRSVFSPWEERIFAKHCKVLLNTKYGDTAGLVRDTGSRLLKLRFSFSSREGGVRHIEYPTGIVIVKTQAADRRIFIRTHKIEFTAVFDRKRLPSKITAVQIDVDSWER